MSLGPQLSGILITNSSCYYHEFGFNCYAGALVKKKIYKNFFFVPSLDFYYSCLNERYDDGNYARYNYFTFGPTIGFEFFFGRFSINTDILNINLGLRSQHTSPYFYGYFHSSEVSSYTTIYK